MRTIIHFLLDETGSMEPRAETTVSALNEYIKTLQSDENKYRFSFHTFNSGGYTTRMDDVKLENVAPFRIEDYTPNNLTPLVDALYKTVNSIKARKGQKVIVAVLTDGLENASRKNTSKQLHQLINARREKKGWQFVFMGVDIDAYTQAGDLGFAKGSTLSMSEDDAVPMAMMAMASNTLRYSRGMSATMDYTEDQKAEIESLGKIKKDDTKD